MSAARKQDAPASTRPKSSRRRPRLVAVVDGTLSPAEQITLLTSERDALRRELTAAQRERIAATQVIVPKVDGFDRTFGANGQAPGAGAVVFVERSLRILGALLCADEVFDQWNGNEQFEYVNQLAEILSMSREAGASK